MPAQQQKGSQEKSRYPRPWWLDQDDNDLHATTYVDETSADVDDEDRSTSSSLYIEDTRAEAPRASQRRESPHQESHRRPSTQRTASSSLSSPARQKLSAWQETGKSKFKHAVDYLKPKKPASGGKCKAISNNDNGNNNCAVVKWNCEACTYRNVKDVAQSTRHHPMSHVTCDVCGTPHVLPLNNTGTTSNLNTTKRSNTDCQDDLPIDPVETIERILQLDLETANEGTDAEEIRQCRNTSSRNMPASSENASSSRKSNKRNVRLPFFQQKLQTSDTADGAMEQSSSGHTRSPSHSDGISETSLGTNRQYSVSELIASLGANDVELPPALERRVRDFKFAQTKRREKHGDQKPWGIYGLYAHLSDIRSDLEWAEDAAWRRQRGQPYLSWRDFDKSRDQGLHNRPLFTYGILFLCSVMMFVTFGVNGWKFEPLKVNPLIGPSSETLIKCGARDTSLIVNEGQWYRLFTPMILHAGLVHFFINMLALYFIGGAVEQSHGFASASILFIIPAVGGNILSAICLPQYISVGASGGIFGMIGGCIADIGLNWNLLFLKTTTDGSSRNRHLLVLLWLGMDVVLNCVLGFTPYVDNFTHLGGFMYGLFSGISTIERLAVGFFGISTEKCSQLGHTTMRFFGIIVSIIAIMVTTVVLVQMDGTTSPCPGCRYISCVPFPPNAVEKWWYCDDCDTVTADLFRAGDGSGMYEQINVHCPNGAVEEIVISEDGIDDKDVLQKALPGYCRAHCATAFSSG